jgi:hypothetical protein
MRGCEASCDWVELGDIRRHTVQMRPILPRQEHAESYSAMNIFVCELERDPNDPTQENVRRVDWTASVDEKPLPDSGIRVLSEGTDRETYVVVSFELGQPAEALERKFSAELDFRLYPGRKDGQPRKLMDLADGVAKWQSDIPPDQLVYPPLWKEALDPNAQAHTRENVVTIPNRQSPFVLCWIPARYSPEQLRSRFNNAVREEKRQAIAEMCASYWALPEKIVFGGKPEVLPPWPAYEGVHPVIKRKLAKWTNTEDFWLGLMAYEFRQAGIKFDRSADGQAALEFFRANGLPDDPDLIRPALAAVTERLREIDDLYAKLF